MSVTRVETWLANPYAVFARDILKLEKLPSLGADPSQALRGSIVHEIMSRFAHRFPEALPDDPGAILHAIADEVMADYVQNPRVAAFWLPRFKRFAEWFAETEPARRKGVDPRGSRGRGQARRRGAGRALHAVGACRPHRSGRSRDGHHRLQDRNGPDRQ